jgi:WS/DGAT/MGAT family acyltransferase
MANLRIEDRGLPMHVAALGLLDGRPLLDGNGELRMERLRRHVAERIRDVRRLHQVLAWPRGRHRAPVWQDADQFEIADHVKARRVPGPGDERTLLRVCSELNAPPLDRSRALWELWLLDGLADGRLALLLRLHHVVADGAAALELFSSLFDPSPQVPTEPTRVSAAHHRHSPVEGVKGIGVVAALRARQVWVLARLGRAPALSWNQPVGTRRMHILIRGDLAGAKFAAHAQGGKVNDVVLAAVAGGAHRLLERRGELAPGLDMHVSVAASIRRPGEAGGNRVAVRPIGVPVSQADATARLASIAARTSTQRGLPPVQPSGRFLQRWLVHLMAHQRLVNMVLSNMPGPPMRLSFDGARVLEMFQLTVVQGNCPIGVGAFSYAGQLNFDVVADADLVPDVQVFADGVAETLDQLGAARAPSGRPEQVGR